MSPVGSAALVLALLPASGCQVVSGLGSLEVPDRDDGEECVVDPECKSGFCTDGVCCNDPCEGDCVTCRAAESRGICLAHPIHSDPDGDCGQFGRCDGNRGCFSDGYHIWSRSFGGPEDQTATGLALRNGDSPMMIGGFNGSITFEREHTAAGLATFTPNDLYVASFDADGNPQASRGMGDDKVERPTAVATDASGNIILAGTFLGALDFGGILLQAAPFKKAVFLATLTADNLVTARAKSFSAEHPGYSDTTRVGSPAVAIVDDDVLLAGHFRGAINFGPGPMTSIGDQDYYLARFDANRDSIWNNGWGSGQTAGDNRLPFAPRLTADADGNAYLAGSYCHDLAIGGYALARDSQSAYQAFVAKIGSDGQPLWAKSLGGEGQQRVTGMATGDDGIAVVGVFTSELAIDGQLWFASDPAHVDLFITKLDAAGNPVMTRTFPGSPALGGFDGLLSAPEDVEIDANGNVVLFGQLHGTVRFGTSPLVALGLSDAFIAKFNAGLEHLWSKRYGDDESQAAWAGGVTADGSILAAGMFLGEVDFGSDNPLQSAGGSDAFLVKLSP